MQDVTKLIALVEFHSFYMQIIVSYFIYLVLHVDSN